MKDNQPLVLILCGGQSLRLWPLSEYKSKNFLDIFGFSPLEFTVKRFLKITCRKNIFLAASCHEKNAISKLKLVRKENIFCEPQSKNTAPAILLSLFYLKNKFSQDKVLIVSPVDHLIREESEFISALQNAVRVAKSGWICTLGIKPDQATPNFGYIQISKEIEKDTFSIKKFIEKPSRPEAQELIRKGDSFYNSGVFISSLSVLDKEYKKYYPYYGGFKNIIAKSGSICEKEIKNIYKKIDDIPFDKAIMEKTNKVRLIKGNFYWRDFGNWQAIYDVLAKDQNYNVKKGNISFYDSENDFIYSDDTKKKVLVLGLKDVFFVDTGKFVLLAHRHSLDNLKPALKEFKN